MIKTLTACSIEIDDPDTAVSEILEQLDLERAQLKNSVGLLACHVDFMVENDTVRKLCAELPFDVIGIDTLGSATNRGGGQFILNLTVLTSDDVFFSVGASRPLTGDTEEKLRELYNMTQAGLPEEPKLILFFCPFSGSLKMDFVVDYLNQISGGVPLFGMVPSDFTTSYRNPMVLFDGVTSDNTMALLMLSGNITPKFDVINASIDKIIKRPAIVTEAEDNILKKINNDSAIDYLNSIGLADNRHIIGVQPFALFFSYKDDVRPVARAVIGQTQEGHVILAGNINVNGAISVGVMDHDYIIETAKDMVTRNREYSFKLIASCLYRNFALGLDNMDEIEAIRSNADVPFLFAYSGGEICPIENSDGKLVNRHHNLALTCCSF
ncbi:hypothetical protein FACS1894187_00140 [Synergistales bacterium]|nr:hypothetical protein FACS1894187_00140 [Synergistales bacterium]